MKLILAVFLAGLLLTWASVASPPISDERDEELLEVPAEMFDYEEADGMKISAFTIEPNKHQYCECTVSPPKIECYCDDPGVGLCLETSL